MLGPAVTDDGRRWDMMGDARRQARAVAPLITTFWNDLHDWFDRSLAWLAAVFREDPHLPPRPETFVRSNTQAFVASARGVVWDCRRASSGVIRPLDFTAKQGVALERRVAARAVARLPGQGGGLPRLR
eukprot:298438-Prymnesium_polylepis.1